MEDVKYAKVPTGMTIDKPSEEPQQEKRTTKEKPLSIKDFDIDPGLPVIQYPHYTNNARSELGCLLIIPDGMVVQEKAIKADKNNPLFRDILAQFTEAEIDTNTKREIQIASSRDKAMQSIKEDEEREKTRHELWEVKSSFMDLDVVKNSDEKLLKRQIRKATNYFEAFAYGVAVIVKESEKNKSE